MEIERWDLACEAFAAAAARPPEERPGVLQRLCVGPDGTPDPELRAEVESLLICHTEADGFLSSMGRTVAELAAEAVGRADAAPGHIGRFQVAGEIARGGMGVVYAARDPDLDREVALKVLAPALVATPSARAALLREARAVAALDHPHVCTVLEAGEDDDGRVYLAMPRYQGETLRDRLRRGPVEPAEAARIVAEAAEGLAAAHALGIVHRDVKPANLFLARAADGSQRTVVLDFGIARAAQAATTTPRGTPAYMAPEQRENRETDARADVWALGAVLWEALTGHRPGSPPLHPPPHIPTPLARVASACLQAAPEARPPSAAALAARLRAAAAPPRPRPTGLLLLGLLALGLLLWAFAPRSSPPATSGREAVAVFPFEVVGPDAYSYLGEGLMDLVSAGLEGGYRSVDPASVLAEVEGDGVVPPDAARRHAARLRADRYVQGRVTILGGEFHLTASLYATGGHVLATARTRAAEETELVGELDRLLATLVAAEIGPDAVALADVATPSLPALKAHLGGERLIRRQRFAEAALAFERAVAYDSTYALAWSALARVAFWRSDVDGLALEQRAVEAAYRHRHPLPLRRQRLIGAAYHGLHGERAQTEALYRLLVDDDPRDPEALALLGGHLADYNGYLGRPVQEGRLFLERADALAAPQAQGRTLIWLAELAGRRGDRAALRHYVDRYLADGAGQSFRDVMRHYPLLLARDPEALAAAVEGAGAESLRQLYHRALAVAGDPDGARVLALELTRPSRPLDERVMGHERLALGALMDERTEEAERHLAEASRLDPANDGWLLLYAVPVAADPHLRVARPVLTRLRERVARHDTVIAPLASPMDEFVHQGRQGLILDAFHGLLSARLGDHADVRRRLARLERAAPGDPLTRSLAAALSASDDLAQGQPARALATLEAAAFTPRDREGWISPLYAQNLQRMLRARAHLELGQPRDALRWYDAQREIVWARGSGWHLRSYTAGRARCQTVLGRPSE